MSKQEGPYSMQLTVFERLTLLNILPREGNFLTLKILREMRENLSFSEEEHKMLQFKNAGDKVKEDSDEVVPEGKVLWNMAGDVVKDVGFGEKATDIIVERLKTLDKEKKLTDAHFSLYEKFVLGKEPGKE
jgi:hypothetical protein